MDSKEAMWGSIGVMAMHSHSVASRLQLEQLQEFFLKLGTFGSSGEVSTTLDNVPSEEQKTCTHVEDPKGLFFSQSV